MPQRSDEPEHDPVVAGQVPHAPQPAPIGTPGDQPTQGRLHPAALGVWGVSHLGAAVALLIAGTIEWPILLGGAVLGAGALVLRWVRFRWRIEPDAFVIEQGLLQRQQRVIPFERIQTVEVGRKLRHRIFGVVELHVETVGGSKTEGRLDALDPDTARAVRARLLRLEAAGSRAELGEVVGEEPGEQLARMAFRDLVAAGLTGGRVGVVAVIFGFAQELLGNRLQRGLQELPSMFGPVALVGVTVFAATLIFVISVVATALVYWDFTLRRDGSNLRIRRGLLDQRLDTIPLRRIQALRVEENLVRRLLGLATVKMVVAGRAGGNQARDTGTLLPIASHRDALALVEAILDRPDVATAPLQPMPLRARNRRLVRAALATAVVTVVLVVAFGWSGLGGLALGPPAAWLALDSYRALGSGRHGQVVVARSGAFIRRTAFVPEPSLQSLALTSTPLQRQRDLASIELQIAHPQGTKDPRLIDLDAYDAWGIMTELAETAARPGPASSPTEAEAQR